MKHGVKPTREQRKLMEKWKLNSEDWLVERETLHELVLIHRHFDNKTKIVPKGVAESSEFFNRRLPGAIAQKNEVRWDG